MRDGVSQMETGEEDREREGPPNQEQGQASHLHFAVQSGKHAMTQEAGLAGRQPSPEGGRKTPLLKAAASESGRPKPQKSPLSVEQAHPRTGLRRTLGDCGEEAGTVAGTEGRGWLRRWQGPGSEASPCP